MADETPLTKSDLVSALKEIGVATKDDVREIIKQEVPEIIKQTVPPMIAQSERRMQRFIRAEINLIREDMAKLALSTPTRKEFNDLKEQVAGVRPAS